MIEKYKVVDLTNGFFLRGMTKKITKHLSLLRVFP